MALLGKAAIVIWSEMEPAYLAEHDAWHSSEHLPERMRVPGFLRGRRWAAIDPRAEPRFVLYEIEDIAVSTSAPYLERLNHPTPRSQKVMANCRLSRTLCRVASTHGAGIGEAMLAIRLSPQGGREAQLEDWLGRRVLPELAQGPGVVGAHLLQKDRATERPRTNEERLRRAGVDAEIDSVVLVEAFDLGILQGLLGEALAGATLARHGAATSAAAFYRLAHAMNSHG